MDMKKLMIAALMVIATIASVKAQYGNGNQAYSYNDDRYYYDNDFDWHWDIRVKISNGIQRGLLTQNESNRLYGVLEDVERKEYAYQSDGLFSGWEQQEIWDDVIYLNQRLGIELNDYDRNFYGFDVYGYDRRGYNRWFYQGGYDFFRFDKRGFGSVRLGYIPRPNYNGWYRHNDNHNARRYYSDRRYLENRGNNHREYARGNWNNGNNGNHYGRDSRRDNDYNRNRSYGNENGRNNSQGNNDNRRNDRIEMPNSRPNNNGNGFPNGGGRPERNDSKNNGNGFPNGGGRPERNDSNNSNGLPQRNIGERPERVEVPISRPQTIDPPQVNTRGRLERNDSNNRSDNGNQGSGNGRSESPQSGGNGENRGGSRGPR
jgi:hypothetical protein